ncbi:MAG: AAA family ATPase [Deltaproteobacteria bacterium]|nr:AAA family ATPase [Deltaproteobacteria bacterium]
MIEGECYFVLHAPRQSGKTTCVRELTRQINSDGKYYAIKCSLDSLQNIEDTDIAMNRIFALTDMGLRNSGVAKLKNLVCSFSGEVHMNDSGTKIRGMLNGICSSLDKELVVFFDEADCLHEDPLITFWTQIRGGCLERDDSPESVFPRSMALVGMRNLWDCKHRVRQEDQSAGLASPFTIITESFSLANFSGGKLSPSAASTRRTRDRSSRVMPSSGPGTGTRGSRGWSTF